MIQFTIGLEVYTILLIMLLHYFKESHVSKNCRYHIAGNFLGVKFSWITKKNYWWSKIRISRWKEIISIRKMASNSNSFEVEAMIRGYHKYKDICEGEVGDNLQCQRQTCNP